MLVRLGIMFDGGLAFQKASETQYMRAKTFGITQSLGTCDGYLYLYARVYMPAIKWCKRKYGA